jgi:glutamine synthetase type III
MSTSAPRIAAVQTAQNRIPRHFERPQSADGRLLTSKEYFGVNTFSDEQMRARLSGDVYRKYRAVVDGASTLDRPTADAIAKAVFEWAQERGATHFCHWFQPLTGLTAEKHDAFLEMSDARAVTKFTGGRFENINSVTRIATLLPEIGQQAATTIERQSHLFRVMADRPAGASGNVGRISLGSKAPLKVVGLSFDGRLR